MCKWITCDWIPRPDRLVPVACHTRRLVTTNLKSKMATGDNMRA